MSIKRLQHARHNETVCFTLCADKDNADWIVTTAFYASLHYVEYKIFPIKFRDAQGNKIVLKTFEVYYGFYHPNNSPNKHAVRSRLVSDKIASISAHYSWLKSACHTARYTEYQFADPEGIISEAKRRLEEVKNCCEG